MAGEPQSNKNPLRVKLKTVDLRTPTLVDRIGKVLLDHLAECEKCFSIFAAQEESIEVAGCVEGIRIISQSQVRWEEHRSALALRHLTEEVLYDFIFDRLTSAEKAAIEKHADSCLQCAKELRDRRSLIKCMKAVFGDEADGRNVHSHITTVNVRFPGRSLSACAGSK